VPVGAGITRILMHFGFMKTPNVMDGRKLACIEPDLRGIDPQNITYYFGRVMVIPRSEPSGGFGGVRRERDSASLYHHAVTR
jgi:KUP system potassium uptake protein